MRTLSRVMDLTKLTIAGMALGLLFSSTAFAQTCDNELIVSDEIHYDTGGSSPRHLLLADFNKDGIDDMVVNNTETFPADFRLSIMMGTSDGRFEPAQTVLEDVAYSVDTGDLDGDGNLDLVVQSLFYQTTSILYGYGSGTFEGVVTYSTGPTSVVHVADLNNDGKLDVVGATDTQESFVLSNKGDRVFEQMDLVSLPGDNPFSIESADLDKDGNTDLVFTYSNGNRIYVFYGDGDNGLSSGQSLFLPNELLDAALYDVNTDGHLDIVAPVIYGNSVAVFLGREGRGFDAPNIFDAGDWPATLVVADLNDDGHADLATANYRSGDVSVLLGHGDGTFSEEQRLGQGLGDAFYITASDLDQDGKQDLLFTDIDSSRNKVSVMMNECESCPIDLDGDGQLSVSDFLAFQDLWEDRDAGADFDGDGRFTIFDFLTFQGLFEDGCE